jgi:hypothetical protein
MSKRVDLRKPPNGRHTLRRDARATPAEVLKMLSQANAQRPAEPAVQPAASRFKNQLKPNQTPEASVAALMVDGVLMNAVTAVAFSKTLGTVDLTESVAALVAEIRRVQGGDLDAAEALLMAQVVALNAMFTHLAAQASVMTLVDQIDCFTRLALKAQGQCRATLETLAVLKNPMTVFTRQANIAHGPQQVNNGPVQVRAPPEEPRARENPQVAPNELLEAHGKRLDLGVTRPTSAGDPAVAPVDAVDRPADR